MGDFRNGHLNWDGWCFDYLVSRTEGLSLLNGYHDGRKVFKKLSLPVIRVKYVKDGNGIPFYPFPDGCGPYADHIQWATAESLRGRLTDIVGRPFHLVRIKRCNNNYVGITTFEMAGDGAATRWLELGVYARIGAYHIYQAYYLSARLICPRMFSRGIACNLEHVHHAYWRLDLDVDGDDGQRLMVVRGDDFAGYVDLEGAYRIEGDLTTRWAVENLRTKSRVWIFPDDLADGQERGTTDAFSVQDANIRTYRATEDIAWPFHTSEMEFEPQEDPDGGDIVFWYVSHLKHTPEKGDSDPWHCAGPTLLIEPAISSEPQPKASLRSVVVAAEITVEPSAGGSSDLASTASFTDTARLDRDRSHAEVAFQTDAAGDIPQVAVEAILTWNADGSVGVDYRAALYGHPDIADSEIHHFNVLRDHSEELNIHLASEGRAPALAHVRLKLINQQRES